MNRGLWIIEKFDDEDIESVKKHKYSAVDTSPLSNYILHPFWNLTVKLAPDFIHPNVLSFVGFYLLLIPFIILAYLDWGFTLHSQPNYMSNNGLPTWLWYVSAVMIFLSHTFDGIDGKQARKLSLSSAIGEFIDHGLDSMTLFIIPMIIASTICIGRDESNIYEKAIMIFVIFFNFYLSHWEKYITGLLFLPWTFDLTVVTCVILLLSFGITNGKLLYYVNVTSHQLFQLIALFIVTVTFFVSLPFSIFNIISYIKKCKKDVYYADKILLPLSLPVLLFICHIIWINCAEYNNSPVDLRVLFLTMGVSFSNITCRLIVCQICHRSCILFHSSILFVMINAISAYLDWRYKFEISVILLSLMFLFNIIYFVSVIWELKKVIGVNILLVPRKK